MIPLIETNKVKGRAVPGRAAHVATAPPMRVMKSPRRMVINSEWIY